MEILSPDTWQMWVTFAAITVAVLIYSTERLSLELTSLVVIGFFLIFFELFPVLDTNGNNLLSSRQLLAGFANPALVAVLALLVVGQGLFHSGALEAPTRWIASSGKNWPQLTVLITLILVGIFSAFLNNTPVAVMFIPVLATLAAQLRRRPSKVMMPLSFICILGGMTTLIGSSTNLLAAGIASRLNIGEIGFFDFTIPGLVLASIGAIYVLVVAPRLLPDREGLSDDFGQGSGKQYIAQIHLTYGHPLVGETAVAGMFPSLKEMTVRMVQRGETPILPPFDDIELQPGDTIIIAATRQTLTDSLKAHANIFQGVLEEQLPGYDDDEAPAGSGKITLVEAVVAPGSRMIGRNIEQIGFRHETRCIVLGIQRRSRMIRARMSDIRLEDGDVLLILGGAPDVQALRLNKDVIPLEWSATEIPDLRRAWRARVIFGATILAAVTGVVPIEVASLAGAAAMIGFDVLNIRQASRAVDRRIFLLVGAALAMGAALHLTGGATFLAQVVVATFSGAGPAVVLSAFFLLVAIMTNMLSNNATAVLFVPIGASTAQALGMDPMIFVYAVIFAANCSFATPMGYQTNLLVMGPGHYQFRDFMTAGGPLILIIWLAFSFFAPWYYGF
ncbi:MAG: SLC13 family permease [Alphaproteobacteria bacterium]|nr:SLC13 family permease [Alphaproteobacteria bacterium]MBO6628973.1 SLC13 family permease [Alphaproteobacteria bacterium]MDF1624804.1 SLC13 family permease [Parvibaculaceae bacterium]